MHLIAMQLSDLPGAGETFQKILKDHSWIPILQSIFIVISLGLNLWFFSSLKMKNQRLLVPRLPSPPWNFEDGILLLARYALLFFGVFIITSAIRQQWGGYLKKIEFSDLQMMMVGVILTQFIALALILHFYEKLKTSKGVSVFSYWQTFRVKGIGEGILLFLMILLPILLLYIITLFLFYWLGLPFEPQPLVLLLQKTRETWFVIALSFFGVIIAPVVEETLFRGILYPTLRLRWGILPALIVNSLIFSLMHFHLPTLLPLFGLAVFFTLAYEVTGSLLGCIVAHSLFNAMNMASIWLLRSAN